MKISTERLLTTHMGSLPRGAALTDLLLRQESGEPYDEAQLEAETRAAVRRVVCAQATSGIDIGNDGEQPRVGFQTYVPQRMSGFAGESARPAIPDFIRFPEYRAKVVASGFRRSRINNAPEAMAEVSYDDLGAARAEAELFEASLKEEGVAFLENFMTAASPGIITTTMLNRFYDSHEAYVMAVAREMRKEYRFIAERGYLLQLDCPDLAMERGRLFRERSIEEFRQVCALHIEAINRAIEGIAPERIRLHCCWGNYDGPHVDDVALADILDVLYTAKVGAIALPFANPRHQHEFEVIAAKPPPAPMVLIAGVIDTTTNYVEHPEVVARRLRQAVEAVGDKERVIAGTDCGFGTVAGNDIVAADVVWAKLAALAEGARLASRRLW